MNRISNQWIKVLMTAAMATTAACDSDIDNEGPEPTPQIEQELPLPGSQTLTTNDHAAVVPGFTVNITLSGELGEQGSPLPTGDDVTLTWDNGGFDGDIKVYRSTDPHVLLDLTADSVLDPTVVEVFELGNATSFVDTDAASKQVQTPNYFYRVGQLGPNGSGDLVLSTMVMKTTTQMYNGYTTLGLCMLSEIELDEGGTLHISDVYAQLGDDKINGMFQWNPAIGDYNMWFPGGGGTDFEIGYGDAISVGFSHNEWEGQEFRSLVGTVPTDEALSLPAIEGLHWVTLPALYDGPTNASHWTEEAGFWGAGMWNSDTQTQQWMWPGDPAENDFSMKACGAYHFQLQDDVCLSNNDCGNNEYCFFSEGASCGDMAPGLCMPKPLDCGSCTDTQKVCGCDGATYDNECKAKEAGVSVDHDGECEPPPPPPPACEMVFDFEDATPTTEPTNPATADVLDATGDWHICNRAPVSPAWGEIMFDSGVLGTDGNRQYPYPGVHAEASGVTLAQITLGTGLRFDSWHMDEGGSEGYDTKRVVFDAADGSSTVLVDCTLGVNPQTFCSMFAASRPGNLWDEINIDTTALDGVTGSLRFEYDTGDDWGEFEQGWFIDNIEVGECGGDGGAIPEAEMCPAECLELEMFADLVTNPTPDINSCYSEDYGSEGIYELHNSTGYVSVYWLPGAGECVSYNNMEGATSVSVTDVQAQACAELIEEQSSTLEMDCTLDA